MIYLNGYPSNNKGNYPAVELGSKTQIRNIIRAQGSCVHSKKEKKHARVHLLPALPAASANRSCWAAFRELRNYDTLDHNHFNGIRTSINTSDYIELTADRGREPKFKIDKIRGMVTYQISAMSVIAHFSQLSVNSATLTVKKFKKSNNYYFGI